MCFLISRALHIRQLPGSPHPGRSEVACHSVMRPAVPFLGRSEPASGFVPKLEVERATVCHPLRCFPGSTGLGPVLYTGYLPLLFSLMWWSASGTCLLSLCLPLKLTWIVCCVPGADNTATYEVGTQITVSIY